MSYLRQTLTGDEEILFEGKVALMSMWLAILIGLILLFAMGAGALLLIYVAIVYFTSEMAITSKRVVAKWGLIRRTSVEVNIANIEALSLEQGIMGRLFNYGTLVVASSGNSTLIEKVKDPLGFRKQVLEIQEKLA